VQVIEHFVVISCYNNCAFWTTSLGDVDNRFYVWLVIGLFYLLSLVNSTSNF